MDDIERERIRWRADWLAFRWVLVQLWADRIKYAPDPSGKLLDDREYSLQNFEAFAENVVQGEVGELTKQYALAELESLWGSLEQRFPPGTKPAPIPFDYPLLSDDDEDPEGD